MTIITVPRITKAQVIKFLTLLEFFMCGVMWATAGWAFYAGVEVPAWLMLVAVAATVWAVVSGAKEWTASRER